MRQAVVLLGLKSEEMWMELANLPPESSEHHALQDLCGAAKERDGAHGPRVFRSGNRQDESLLPLNRRKSDLQVEECQDLRLTRSPRMQKRREG